MQRSNSEFSITTGRDGSRSFAEHDDRWAPRGRGYGRKFNHKNYGRGSFRGRGRGGPPPYGGPTGGRSDYNRVDQEGDVMMGGDADQSHGRRYNPYMGRPKSRRGRDQYTYNRNNNNNNNSSGSRGGGHQGDMSTARRLGLPVRPGGKTWYRVSIPHAKQVEKTTLLGLLANCIPGNFRPIQFQYQGEMVVFFLDDKDVAGIMKSISRSITLPDSNMKLIINVKPSSPPFAVMNDENIEKLKVVLSKRYDPSVKILDCSALYEDKDLQQEGLYLPMHRGVIAETVGKIIKENIPELVGINLSNNRMLSLSSFQAYVGHAPNVTSLDVSKNQLRSIDELDKLKGWQLVELVVDKNPFCDKFQKTEYVSAVRKRFPKVVKLDGTDLPPPIVFDVSADTIPTSLGSHFVNGEVQELVVKFLKEYYTIYDSDNRQPLIDAYHENAVFSLTAAPNPVTEYKQPVLADYFSANRNELRIAYKGRDDREKVRTRDRALKKGRLQIVSELCSLPKTTHDANSFIVDVNLLSSTVLSFVVSGLFKESDNKADKPPIRAFSRCFVAVPASGGVLVTNDTLTLTNASTEQQQVAFKSTGPTPSSSPVSSNPPTLTSPTPSTSAVVGGATPVGVASPVGAASPVGVASPLQQLESLPADRQQMVLSFSQESGMNHIFSFRCLEDNAWDYSKSAEIFLSLQKEGKIPPEAFIKAAP